MTGDVGTRKYGGFLSYSKKDRKSAARLHRTLEAFRFPKGALGARVDPRTRRLGKFFRDDDEMGAASNLGAALRGALEDSDSLIVICSPNAAKSAWVNEEIAHFKLIRRADRIFAVIVDGVPHAGDAVAEEQRAKECFPPALRFEVDSAGAVTDRREEPLAVDLRKESFARVRARLAAGLAGISFDDLWRRDRRRANRRTAGWVSVSVAILILAAGGIWWTTTQVTSARQQASSAQQEVADTRTQLDSESLARAQAETKTTEVQQAADDLTEQKRIDTLIGIGQSNIVRAESYFAQRLVDDYEFATDTTLATEENARWSAAAVAYAIALDTGADSARPLLDRLGYVRMPQLEGKKQTFVTRDGNWLISDTSTVISIPSGARRKLDAGTRLLAVKDNRFFVSLATTAKTEHRATLVNIVTGATTTVKLAGDAKDSVFAAFSSRGDQVALVRGAQFVLLRTSDGAQLSETSRTVPESAKGAAAEVTGVFFTLDGRRIVVKDGRGFWTFAVAGQAWSGPFQIEPGATVDVAPVLGPRLLSITEIPDSRHREQATLWNLEAERAEKILLPDECPPTSDSCGPVMSEQGLFASPLPGEPNNGRMVVSSDGRYFVENLRGRKGVRIHDLSTGARNEVLFSNCGPPNADTEEGDCDISAMVMLSDQPRILAISYDLSARMIDLSSARVTSRLEHKGELVGPFLPSVDGRRVIGIEVTEAGPSRLAVWDQLSGKALSRSGTIMSDEPRIQIDDFARTVVEGATVWRSLAPAGETVEQALARVCGMQGKAGLQLRGDARARFPEAPSDDVCKWPLPQASGQPL